MEPLLPTSICLATLRSTAPLALTPRR
ncbi:hypothetical protein CSUB01_00796 [Colletotrichum sublineola]|uniref:Uncharacterized protein n=1 Tax=Colletotrichum sublineola TaxID=1173701 RepID=A0A066X524_COLSU|nr:hypothetical protein CSUB01_00796 [Colletotrichum sublineola]